MIPSLDFRIFGNGHGFAAPYFDQPFYWLRGEFYTYMNGLGAQLHSVQWTHPKACERRKICGVEFRPFSSRRKFGRVIVAWCTTLPASIDDANDWLRQFEAHLRHPIWPFEYRPAKAIEARSDKTGTGLAVGESAVALAICPTTPSHMDPITETCPDCKGAGYIGGEDFPSNCGNAWHKREYANTKLGFWLSAALDDPNACDEFKADIRRWFAMNHPITPKGEEA